jgi:hypothetical protein
MQHLAVCLLFRTRSLESHFSALLVQKVCQGNFYPLVMQAWPDGPAGPKLSIYVKPSDLANVPSSFRHGICPMLFAEHGTLPSSKDRPKKCLVMVTLAGLCLFRFKSSHYTVSLFTSAYNIASIEYTSPRRRDVHSKTRSFYFICEHANEAVAWILAAREALFSGAIDQRPIQLLNFPGDIPQLSALFYVVGQPIVQFRYVAFCFRYALTPEKKFIKFCNSIDPERTKILTITEEMKCPENLKCLTTPVCLVLGIRVIHLRGFSPKACCAVARNILKESPTVDTVIFEQYSFLIPGQLKMDSLNQVAKAFSIIFIGCALPPRLATSVVLELCKFSGEYRRVEFGGFRLDERACRDIFNAIENARCFRAVEMIGFDSFDAPSLPAERILQSIRSVMNRCRFAQRVSFCNWNPLLSLQPA